MNFLQGFVWRISAPGIWAYHDYNTFGQMISRDKLNKQYYQSKKLTFPSDCI